LKNIQYFPICLVTPSTFFKSKRVDQSLFLSVEPIVEKLITLTSFQEPTLYEPLFDFKGFDTLIHKDDMFKIMKGYHNNMDYVIVMEALLIKGSRRFLVPMIEPVHIKQFVHAGCDHISTLKDRKIDKEALMMWIDYYYKDWNVEDKATHLILTREFDPSKQHQSTLPFDQTPIYYNTMKDKSTQTLIFPLSTPLDNSYENPYYINELISTSALKPLPKDQYIEDIKKSFNFIEDVNLLVSHKSYIDIIKLIDSEGDKSTKALSMIKSIINNKEYCNIIAYLLSDKVFRTYIQYNFKDKILSFDINNSEKITIY
jgi:hypothetical protein